MKTFILLLLALTLAGCTTYRPVPTVDEHKSFRSYMTDEMVADHKTSYEIAHATRALSKFTSVAVGALRDRSDRAWDSSDFTTAGATGAVLGGLAHKAGLLNTGIFTAGLGVSASRYKLDQQVDLSLATFNRLSCMQGRLGMLTAETVRLARTSGDAGAVDALTSAPEDVIRNVEHVQNAHLASLYALKPSTPSKTDLVEYFNRYNAVQTAAATAGATVRAARSAESEAAAKTVRTLSVELEACAKLT